MKLVKFISGTKAGIKEDPEKEGIIEVRPGTKGINLGNEKYAMAYIRVLDGCHCFKGMCVYSNNMPYNYDIICYYRDPEHGLKLLKTVTPEMNLSPNVMTKICNVFESKPMECFQPKRKTTKKNGGIVK